MSVYLTGCVVALVLMCILQFIKWNEGASIQGEVVILASLFALWSWGAVLVCLAGLVGYVFSTLQRITIKGRGK